MTASVLEWTLIANDRASDKFDRVGKHVDGAGAKFAKFGRMAAAGLLIATVAAVKFGADSVKAAADAEKAQRRLTLAWENSALTGDVALTSLRAYNSELQKTTTYDDEAIAGAQAILTNFKLTGQQIKDLTPLLLDYASRTGKDLPSSATDLGKALLGNARGLKAIGIDFKATGDTAKDLTTLTGLLAAKVGGFAEGEADTLAGKLAIMRNRFGEVQEKVGAALIVPLLALADFIDKSLLPKLEDLATWFTQSAPGAFATFAPILQTMQGAWEKLAEAFSDPKVVDALVELITEGLPPLVDLLVTLTPLIPPLAGFLSGVLVPALLLTTKYFEGLSAVTSGNLTKMRDWFRGVYAMSGPIGDVARGITNAFVGAANAIIRVFNSISNGIENLVNSFSGLTGVKINLPTLSQVSLGGVLLGGSTAYKPVTFGSPNGSGGTGGGVNKKVNAGMFADGAVVTKPTFAMVGEGGEPEGIFPLSKAQSMGFGGGGDGMQVTVNVNGTYYGGSTAELARATTESFVQAVSSGRLSPAPMRKALGL